MSFDLGVWYSESPLNDEEAGDIYVQLGEEWPLLEGESRAIASFYQELIQHWPELDTVPEEKIDDKDFCPWSGPIDHSGMAVLMNCVWSMADKVSTFVHELATKYELVLFDPQAAKVYLPTYLKEKQKSFLSRLFGA